MNIRCRAPLRISLGGGRARVNEAIIIAGGLATRLGDLAVQTPKCLQPVSGRPFLDYLLWNLARHGVRRVVLATGRLHEAIEAHVGNGSRLGVEALYSRETTPLGTGGATALAASLLTGDEAMVVNGDGLIDCNYLDLAVFRRSAGVDVAMAVTEVEDVTHFGAVEIGTDGLVKSFEEKKAVGPGLISAGTYVAASEWLRGLPLGPWSLESDAFPALAASGRLAGRAYPGFFAEIGTPESLAAAQRTVPGWRRKPCVFLDRDGVINEELGNVHRIEDFRWMPGMPNAIKVLNDAGWLVIVITNQAGIGRGYYTEEEFAAFTAWIDAEMAIAGAHVDATYYRPHHLTEGMGPYLRACDCRKPALGMLRRAIAEWQPDLERSMMIGDRPSDMEAAAAVGLRGVLYEGGDVSTLVAGLIGESSLARAGESRANQQSTATGSLEPGTIGALPLPGHRHGESRNAEG
jgi:D,D-heptose 1,7-bisphosphate phosphatase